MKSSNFEKTRYHVSFEGNITLDERDIIDGVVNYLGLSSEWSGKIGNMKCVVSGFDTPEYRNLFIRKVNKKLGGLS